MLIALPKKVGIPGRNTQQWRCGCSSVVKYIFSLQEVLGSNLNAISLNMCTLVFEFTMMNK